MDKTASVAKLTIEVEYNYVPSQEEVGEILAAARCYGKVKIATLDVPQPSTTDVRDW